MLTHKPQYFLPKICFEYVTSEVTIVFWTTNQENTIENVYAIHS